MYLAKGTHLHNRYQIEGILGHGGFGITYLARDLQLNIEVALKEYLPRQLARRSEDQRRVSAYSGDDRKHFVYGLKRFLDEAQAIARFDNHPNIVNVKDYFEENGTAYMVMSYIGGVNLKTYLEQKGGKIPFELALNIMMPVMDALREVHGAGILHRDVSPDNVYLTTGGQVILLDFGAARYFTTEYSHSISLILKAGYAPEEQYRRRGKQGAWTDEYSTAATIYRAIAGKAPPEAPDRKEHDTLVPPSQLGVNIPPQAEQALLKALGIRAEDRYPTIWDFQQEISRAAAEEQDATIECPHCRALNAVPTDTSREEAKCGKCGQPLREASLLKKPKSFQSSIRAIIGTMPPTLALFLGLTIMVGLLMVLMSPPVWVWEASRPRTLSGPQESWTPPSTAMPQKKGEALIVRTTLVPPKPPTFPPSASVTTPELEAYDYFKKGLATSDPSQKIALLQQAVKLNPDLVGAYNLLGEVYHERKELNEALKYYNKAISIKPDFEEAYNNLGALNYELKKNTDALANYNKAIKLNAKYADAYYNRGILYYESHKYSKAQEDFTMAINNKRDFAKAYYNRAVIYYYHIKDYSKAFNDFSSAIKYNQNYLEAYDHRGVIYFKFKQYPEALADFSRVISEKPEYADPYYNRGRIYHLRKEYNLALPDYDRALTLKPRFAEGYFARGRLYEETGRRELAWEDYKKGKALKAGHP